MIKNLDTLENNFSKRKEIEGISITSNWKEILTNKIPYGSIIEFYGGSSSGKTTAILNLLSKINMGILYFDTEYCFNSIYAKAMGVDINKIIISKSNKEWLVFDILTAITNNINVNIIVIDSLSAIDYDFLNDLEYKLLEIKKILRKTNKILIISNQIRTNPLTYRKQSFGTKKIKELYSIRIKTEKIKDNKIYLKIKKNIYNNQINKDYILEI